MKWNEGAGYRWRIGLLEQERLTKTGKPLGTRLVQGLRVEFTDCDHGCNQAHVSDSDAPRLAKLIAQTHMRGQHL